jgi:hypothetical protein
MSQQEEKQEIKIPFEMNLRKPVKVDKDTELEVLTFNREPVAGDFADMDPSKMKLGDMLHVLSKVTGQPRKTVIDKLSAKDMFAAIEVLNNFLPDSQTTGEEA